MFFPFLGFGILVIILRAASALSAPHQFYPGIEEDDEIDRLAQLELAGVPIEEQDEIEPPEYYTAARGHLFDEYLHDKDILNLTPKQLNRHVNFAPAKGHINLTPKQANDHSPFGYTAREPQFHLPREALVTSNNRERNEILPPKELLLRPEARMLEPPPPPPPHMKKNSDFQQNSEGDDLDSGGGPEPGAEGIEPFVQPSHVMTSSHVVDHSGGAFATRIDQSSSTLYIILVAAGSAMGVVMLVGAGICWYRINERIKATADVDYPAYGVTGPSKDVSPTGGDRKLAQSAHMYHYQHQKQQMAALQKSPLATDGQGSAGSDLESDDENEEGDYTVYECPGLAPAGDMEVKNPLYQDEPTPATPQTAKCEDEGGSTTTSEGGGGGGGK